MPKYHHWGNDSMLLQHLRTIRKQVRITSILAVSILSAGSAWAQDFRMPNQDVNDQFLFLSKSLNASYLTREAGQDLDQIQFLPHGSDRPTHIIACIEEALACLTDDCADPFQPGDKLTPGVQRINLKTREVETIVRGLTICDGIRTTPWGTVIATEEDFISDTGSAYEILDPLGDDVFTVLERRGGGQPAVIIDQDGNDANDRITKRTALPVIRFEGLYVDETGVIIAGDEERPGSYGGGDTDGGAIFKFIPTNLRAPNSGNISNLDQSPLVSGTSFALQVSCVDNRQQAGQGCEIGAGTWIPLVPTATETGEDLGLPRIGREAADTAAATGYYRPEDLHVDPMFSDPNFPNAVRFCFAATGNAAGSNFGEVQCAVDTDVTAITGETGQVVINRFIEGDDELNQPDNLAFQPHTGILYVIEDNPNGDVWACLPDGLDLDVKSDGCIRVFTLTDPSAEPTGFIFTPDGRNAIFNIQHSADGNMPLVDDFRTDDLILLTGFNVKRRFSRTPDFGLFVDNILESSSRTLFGISAKPDRRK